MGVERLENANPTVFNRTAEREITASELNDDIRDEIDSREVFDILYYQHFVKQYLRQKVFCDKLQTNYSEGYVAVLSQHVRCQMINTIGHLCTEPVEIHHVKEPKQKSMAVENYCLVL